MPHWVKKSGIHRPGNGTKGGEGQQHLEELTSISSISSAAPKKHQHNTRASERRNYHTYAHMETRCNAVPISSTHQYQFTNHVMSNKSFNSLPPTTPPRYGSLPGNEWSKNDGFFLAAIRRTAHPLRRDVAASALVAAIDYQAAPRLAGLSASSACDQGGEYRLLYISVRPPSPVRAPPPTSLRANAVRLLSRPHMLLLAALGPGKLLQLFGRCLSYLLRFCSHRCACHHGDAISAGPGSAGYNSLRGRWCTPRCMLLLTCRVCEGV